MRRSLHLERAISLQRQRQLDAALEAYHDAIAEEPLDATAHTGVATILQQLGKLSEAEAHVRVAVERSPENFVALGVLASNLIEQGRVEEAVAAAEGACRLNPGLLQLESNRLLYSLYDNRMTSERRFALHREWENRVAAPLVAPNGRGRKKATAGRLRIGYVSADFRNHPVAMFLGPILRHHDHAAFEVFCYSDVQTEDATTARLRLLADHWASMRDGSGGVMTDAVLGERIVRDDIDIIVDLAGHTQDNRLGVFARRVAPVQVTHIGYPCTTGLSAMGHRFSDALLDPAGGGRHALYGENVAVTGVLVLSAAGAVSGGGGAAVRERRRVYLRVV